MIIKNGVSTEEHKALYEIGNAVCAPPKPEANDKYKMVRIDGEVIPGSDVAGIDEPEADTPYWYIKLKSGIVYKTTHPVTVVENAK